MRNKNYIKKDPFITFANTISFIATLCYGCIAIFSTLLMFSFKNAHTTDAILTCFIIFPCCFSLPLAINAHINKKDVESLFFLGYMVFAPIATTFLYWGYIDNIKKDSNSIFLLILDIFILCIPYLFLFRNCYLWYKDKKLNNESDSRFVSKRKKYKDTDDGNDTNFLITYGLGCFLSYHLLSYTDYTIGVIVIAIVSGITGHIASSVANTIAGDNTNFLIISIAGFTITTVTVLLGMIIIGL
ncbi:MAG: hypothetical protein K2I71_05350 [Helicobacter sp.]|nr:hypothetical protein [Helicobacter sp.]